MNRDWSFTSKGLVNFFTVIGCAVAVIAVLGYLYVPCWKVRRVPGPPAFPLVGHIPLMARYGPEVFLVLSKRYGPIFRAPLKYEVSFGQTATDNHSRSGAVGIKKFKDISNRSIPSPIAASPLHQKGLFFTRDERWSTMRNTIISIYQPSHLASLVPIMQSIIESSTQKLESSKEEDITFSDLALTLATDTIGQAAFGVNFGLSSKSEPITDSSIGFVRYNQSTGDAVSDFISQHIYSTTQLKMDLSGSLSIVLGLVVPIIQEPFRQILKRIPGTMDWKVEKTNRKLSGRLDEIVSKRTEDLWKVSCYPIFGQIKILQILELRNAGRDTARETVPLKIKSSQHCKLAN